MAQIVTVINFKGGVGKTTCGVEIAVSLARHFGRRTLLVDLDPQASATFYVMEQEHWKWWREERGTTYNLFEHTRGDFPVRNAIVSDVLQEKSTVLGFDLLPSNPDLVDVDLRLTDFVGHTILQRYFDQIGHEYDYIICDCPPNFNPVTKNSLWASSAYIVPTVPDFLSTYGIGLLQRSVNKLFAVGRQSPSFKGAAMGGIVLTRIKTNVRIHAAYCEQVRSDYPGKVFKHAISDSIVMATAADNRKPISSLMFPNERERELQHQFRELTGEFISRIYHLRALKTPHAELEQEVTE